MGLRSLESFMEKNANCCRSIKIQELVKKNSNNVIVVDIKSCFYWILQNANLPYATGGQMKEVAETLENFVKCFKNLGINLVVFSDGVVVPELIDNYIARKREKLEEIANFFKKPDISIRIPILPNNVEDIAMDVFRKHNIKMLQSIGECDFEVAKYARDNNCLAVLAQDSDYLFFKFNQPYISMKNLNLKNMTSIIYDKFGFASQIRLPVDDLYWLKIIMETFEVDLKNGWDKWKFHKVANFITKAKTANLLDPFSLASNYRVSQNDFKKVVEGVSYDILYWNLKQFNKKDLPTCENDNWNNILKKIEDLHTNNSYIGFIYATIVMSKYVCGVMLEDYDVDTLTPNQTLLKKLRQKIYGILLMEKPGMRIVEEYGIFEKKHALVLPIFPKCKHSGLIAYWSEDNKYDDEKWSLFCEALNISNLKGIEPHLIVPIASIKYLMNEGFEINDWELDALLMSIILPKFMTVENLKALPFKLNARAVRIYTTVAKAFLTVLWLNNALGFPVDKNMASTIHYQEGKLFQYIYYKYYKYHAFELDPIYFNQMSSAVKSIEEIQHVFKNL